MAVVVISPHNQCNCRCVMCDIWRIREPQEITPADLERQLASFRELGVRWVVFTGGEPQMNSQLQFVGTKGARRGNPRHHADRRAVVRTTR